MLVTYKQLRPTFGITFTPQHILRLEKAGKFPPRRKVGNLNFWVAEEVRAWIDGLRRPTLLPTGE